MKKLVNISGHILFGLVEGRSAFISCDEGIIQTSKVVNILETTKERVHFETINSEYRVTPEPPRFNDCSAGYESMCA